jgi:hypothetical protein
MLLPADLDQWMASAQNARRAWLAEHVPMAERRPMLLQALNDLYARRRAAQSEQRTANREQPAASGEQPAASNGDLLQPL